MNEEVFFLSPEKPNSDTKLTILSNGQSGQIKNLTILEWRRILPTEQSILVDNKGFEYQCCPLDKECKIQAKVSYQKSGSITHKSIFSQPVTITKQLKSRQLYKFQSSRSLVSVDQFKVYMNLSVTKQKLKLEADIGIFEIPLISNTIDADNNNLNCIRVDLQNCRNQFLSFYSACLKWKPRFRSEYCICCLNDKIERDLIMSQVADIYQINMSGSMIKNSFPNNGRIPSFAKDSSNMAGFEHDKSKNKDRQKMKITQKLSLMRSYNKIGAGPSGGNQDANQTPQKSPISANLLQSGECLNIFEDDNEEMLAATNTHSGSGSSGNKLDQSMDLRGSFQEIECTGPNQTNDKFSNNSRSTKNNSSLESENTSLRQQNHQLKKKLEGMDKMAKQLAALKKKYMSSIDQINRLENQRRTIITDKVKFQSKYHKQLQDKQLLLRELENLRSE